MKRSPIRRASRKRGSMTLKQRAELDALLRRALMLRVGAYEFENGDWIGTCERCRCQRKLFTSHIEPKGRVPHLRWDLANVVALCYVCHIHWWHKAPREAEAWITAHLGGHAREHLALRARTGRGKPDYFTTKLWLTQQMGGAA